MWSSNSLSSVAPSLARSEDGHESLSGVISVLDRSRQAPLLTKGPNLTISFELNDVLHSTAEGNDFCPLYFFIPG
jgi:hypothetical protein